MGSQSKVQDSQDPSQEHSQSWLRLNPSFPCFPFIFSTSSSSFYFFLLQHVQYKLSWKPERIKPKRPISFPRSFRPIPWVFFLLLHQNIAISTAKCQQYCRWLYSRNRKKLTWFCSVPFDAVWPSAKDDSSYTSLPFGVASHNSLCERLVLARLSDPSVAHSAHVTYNHWKNIKETSTDDFSHRNHLLGLWRFQPKARVLMSKSL